MIIELNRTDLLESIKGVVTHFTILEDELILKIESSDSYGGKLYRGNLTNLTDEELYKLYIIFKNSWK